MFHVCALVLRLAPLPPISPRTNVWMSRSQSGKVGKGRIKALIGRLRSWDLAVPGLLAQRAKEVKGPVVGDLGRLQS